MSQVPYCKEIMFFFLFRFNKFILNAFSHYKASLPLYTDAELEFPGVEIHELTFQSTGAYSANQLITFMEKSEIGLTGYIFILPAFYNHREIHITNSLHLWRLEIFEID